MRKRRLRRQKKLPPRTARWRRVRPGNRGRPARRAEKEMMGRSFFSVFRRSLPFHPLLRAGRTVFRDEEQNSWLTRRREGRGRATGWAVDLAHLKTVDIEQHSAGHQYTLFKVC